MVTFVLRKNGLSKKDEQAIYRYLKRYKDKSNIHVASNLILFSERGYGDYLKVFLKTFNPQSTIPFVNEQVIDELKKKDKKMVVIPDVGEGGTVEYFKWLKKEVKFHLKELDERDKIVGMDIKRLHLYLDKMVSEYLSMLNLLNSFLEIANIGIKYPNLILEWVSYEYNCVY